jgi:regulatory protein
MVTRKTEPTLHVRAMRALARREYSRAELRAKLLHHAAETDDVDAVLDALIARGWLSDARAAVQLVHARRGRFGSQRIMHELRQKGIADELIRVALPQLKETELAAACQIWQKKFGVLPQDAKEKARQMRFLQSRGFSMEMIFQVLRTQSAISDPD